MIVCTETLPYPSFTWPHVEGDVASLGICDHAQYELTAIEGLMNAAAYEAHIS